MKEPLRCPKCGEPLRSVDYPSNSPLNRDQWESVIPGDLFCACHNNHKGNKPYAYFWRHELIGEAAPKPPKLTEWDFDIPPDNRFHDPFKTDPAAATSASPQPDAEHELRNLLAIIHRDGGHYADEHGLHKATEDAMKIYYELRTFQEDAAQKIASLLPETFYADRDITFRVERLRDGWRNAVNANVALEEKIASLQAEIKNRDGEGPE